jgi:integrase
MATIRERGKGVWEVRVFTGRDESGRPTQVSQTVRGGKRDAQRVAAALETRPARAAGGRTVADVLDAWVAQNLSTWAASSARDQQSRVRSIQADPIAGMSAARLAVSDVERWHVRLRKAGLGDGGIRNQHAVLRAALAQAVRWSWVTTNVAALARLRSGRERPRGVLSADEVRAVLKAAETIDPAAALALRLAAVAGARRAELAALRWDDVHGRTLTIGSAIEVVRRGDGSPLLRDTVTKTANVRVLTLDDDTLAAVESLRAARSPYGPWLFGLGPDLVNPDRIGWWWRRSRQIAGVDVRWRLHDLRHWSATVAIGQGHDVRTVAGRLGHANPAMTLRVYAHAFATADEKLAEGLGAILTPSGGTSASRRG